MFDNISLKIYRTLDYVPKNTIYGIALAVKIKYITIPQRALHLQLD